MYFQNYKPSPLLSKFIDCYFTVDLNQLTTKIEDLIVPDGTFGLIFIDDESAIERSLSTNTKSLPLKRTSIFGQKTYAVNYVYSSTKNKVFGLKIKPSGMFLFTKDVINIKNVFVDVNDLNDKSLICLEEKVLQVKSTIDRIKIVENFILNKLNTFEVADDLKLLEAIINTVYQYKGSVKFEFLLKNYNTSYKRIERIFLKYLGIPPKVYMRIVRFNATINTYQNTNFKENLTQLALANGFFDQSHLIKEFKQFASITPKQFFEKELSFSENEYINIISSRW